MNRRLVEKADRLLQKERGTVFKDPGGRINIALVYPNRYGVGMSSLGFQGIYGLLNSQPDVLCERAFLPEDADIETFQKTRSELFTLESKRPLSRFDIVAFSVSFENDYPNILRILELAKIPVLRPDRSLSHPLVVMGGTCAFYNPEPLAGFFDLFFVGEAEEMIAEFLDLFRRSHDRESLLREAAGIEGLYVPGLYGVEYHETTGQIIGRRVLNDAPEMVRERKVSDISGQPMRHTILTPEAEFSDMYLVEAMRGCPWNCRFCVAGHLYKPVRKKDIGQLKAEISRVVGDNRRVGLIGPSLSDHPQAGEILSLDGVDFSITSLRASPRSGGLVKLMSGRKSVSIAPEAGTQRLRDVVNKRIGEEDILETARLILGQDIETLRLYFMVGLPFERDEDIQGIVALVKKAREQSSRGLIRLTVSTFVPKPFTPFQWHPMEDLDTVKRRLGMIVKGLSRVKGVRVFHDVPKYAYVQGVFSMGDRRVGDAVEAMARGRVVSRKGIPLAIDPTFYVFRKRDVSERLPWDFIDAGIPKERLWQEYQRAVVEGK